jgi:hypothetical protein
MAIFPIFLFVACGIFAAVPNLLALSWQRKRENALAATITERERLRKKAANELDLVVEDAMNVILNAGMKLQHDRIERCDGRFIDDAEVVNAAKRLLAAGKRLTPESAALVQRQVFPQDELDNWNAQPTQSAPPKPR